MPAWSPRRTTPFVVLLACTLGLAPAAQAMDLSGRKTLSALTADGARVELGTVQFTPAAGGAVNFKIEMKHESLSDHFLSMREFKCLPGEREISCHVPYPYRQPGQVRPGELAWLEHSLLFFYKTPADFGAKLWNGLYFEFKDTGTALVGEPKAVDLNQIGAPPVQMDKPPYTPAERHTIPEGSRWIRRLILE